MGVCRASFICSLTGLVMVIFWICQSVHSHLVKLVSLAEVWAHTAGAGLTVETLAHFCKHGDGSGGKPGCLAPWELAEAGLQHFGLCSS